MSADAQIAKTPHLPVLPDAVLAMGQPCAGEIWVDCTLGFGGHTELLLKAGARVIGVDQDAEARDFARHRLAVYGDRFQALAGNFRDVEALLDDAGIGPVDGMLADIGVSSWQLDQAERGFSFQRSGPVDMRMNPTAGRSALTLIQESTHGQLAQILSRYGEERQASRVAGAMQRWAETPGEKDTLGLAAAVASAIPARVRAKSKINPATRSFQALRIAVNDELGALEGLLEQGPRCLAPGGRLLVISFHSLEDRMVKRAFRALTERPSPPRRGLPPPPGPPPAFEALCRKPVIATPDESAINPRARSAKLRGIRALALGAGCAFATRRDAQPESAISALRDRSVSTDTAMTSRLELTNSGRTSLDGSTRNRLLGRTG